MNKFAVILIPALFAASACSYFQPEPGPAERIGRSIDQIRQGIAELAPEETAEERRAREDREWQRRQDDYYRRNRNADSLRGSQRNSENDNFDLYRDRNESEAERRDREARDKEYWDNPPKDDSRNSDRY